MSLTGRSLGASAPVSQASGSISGSAALGGASAAVAEMLRDVDDLSDSALFGLATENHHARHQRKMNLHTILSDESVSGLKRLPPQQHWRAEQHEAWLVQAAALCSMAVYRKDSTRLVPEIKGYKVEDIFWAEPTRDGTKKTAALFRVEELETGSASQNETTLVVAVRGSAGTVDWIVNLDNNPGSYPDLLGHGTTPIPLVHRGFAQCAQALVPIIRQQIQNALEQLDGRNVSIVFTGHSAGAAVASLLFCQTLIHDLQGLDTGSARPTLSCITFGAPPMLTTSITTLLDTAFSRKECPYIRGPTVSFAIEGDPIPRMDGPYAARLAELYKKVGGSNCVTVEEVGKFNAPLPSLHGVGRLVMLYDKHQESDLPVGLEARLIDMNYLKWCVWGNFFAHKMWQYEEWSIIIAAGRFNGKHGWPPPKSSSSGKRWWKIG